MTSYMHTIPDSHFWTNIDQILEWLKNQNLTEEQIRKHLVTGLENTIAQGYQIIKVS